MITGNLFSGIPEHAPKEVFERLLETPHLKLERIISAGHATPPGKWYDPDTDEWVLLLSGAARGPGNPYCVPFCSSTHGGVSLLQLVLLLRCCCS